MGTCWMSDGPGWIVIHADGDGAPGEVVGYAAVQDGENMDVLVDIDTEMATETLYAMLHTDAGIEGTYEFPGNDTPVQVEGEVLVKSFTVADLTVKAQPEVTATPEATATVTATVETDEEEPTTLPVTGGPTTPWTSLLLVAGGLAALAGGAYLIRRRQTEDVQIDR